MKPVSLKKQSLLALPTVAKKRAKLMSSLFFGNEKEFCIAANGVCRDYFKPHTFPEGCF
ncbi:MULTISPECIES: hypothetical protein [unclassified Serratia (in: enterobacteria)]|uniref:hypothetical protein n=1 Tax=unclassified Serratia (in: enterobacteria) TaxID=2647522 RepID=UPI003F9EED89